uniref:RING-type domain-containing protein n=1 Tax=Monodelphis domestica TaxID=13616 RepID=A0A5F8H8G5_MONDO
MFIIFQFRTEWNGYFSSSYSSFPLEPVTSRGVENLSPLNTSPYSYSESTEDAGILTYQAWPLTFLSPLDLARVGFYYIGPGDMVAFFACGGKLSNWEPKDDHAKWFSRCEYLIQMKGQEFVDQVQARYPHLLEELLSTSDMPGDENADLPIIHFGPGENNSEDTVMMNTPVIKAALEMGFSRSLVKQIIQSKILTTGENYKTMSLQARELSVTILVKGNAAASVFKNRLREIGSVLYNNLFGLPMEEQLRRLQEERTCKVCMNKEVSIVFIPCGHLVICKECAPSPRKCPICRFSTYISFMKKIYTPKFVLKRLQNAQS